MCERSKGNRDKENGHLTQYVENTIKETTYHG